MWKKGVAEREREREREREGVEREREQEREREREPYLFIHFDEVFQIRGFDSVLFQVGVGEKEQEVLVIRVFDDLANASLRRVESVVA